MTINITQEKQMALAQKAEKILQTAQLQCLWGYYFPEVIFHLNNQIYRLRKTPEYKLIQNPENILKSLVDFSVVLQDIDQKMQELFSSICKQAKPGVVVEDFIIQETNALNKDPIFEKMIELGAKTIARYINNKENIKKIHECVIQVRIEVCKEKIKKNKNNFYELQTEIKKITHYRVRRNVLSKLFETLLQDNKLFDDDLKSKEKCLLMLQQEYLFAIYRQIENMVLEKAIPFLSKIQHDPIFKPLPKRKWFSPQNKEILSELRYLLMYGPEHVLNKKTQSEPPSLYHIDSPIEQDIIGEMTRRLANSIQYNSPKWQSFNTINEIMEYTHKLLTAPDFEPEKTLEDLIVDSKQHNQFILLLMNEKNIPFRLDRVLMLYDFVTNKFNFGKNTFLNNLGLRTTEKEKAVRILQECYFLTLMEFPDKLQGFSDEEKKSWHEIFLREALHLELFNSTITQKQVVHNIRKLKEELKKVTSNDKIDDRF